MIERRCFCPIVILKFGLLTVRLEFGRLEASEFLRKFRSRPPPVFTPDFVPELLRPHILIKTVEVKVGNDNGSLRRRCDTLGTVIEVKRNK
jgi:hypothetical protein